MTYAVSYAQGHSLDWLNKAARLPLFEEDVIAG